MAIRKVVSIEQAAQIVAEEARQNGITVSELFYWVLGKGDMPSFYTTSEVILRACEIMEQKKCLP
jgi:hypothetical protein